MTADIDFEDPFTRWMGIEDVTAFVDVAGRYVEDTDVTVHAELHGAHEIVLDMTMAIKTKLLPDLPLSTRFVYEATLNVK